MQVNYPTVLTLGQGTKITVSSNKLNNYSDLTVSGPGTITGQYGLIRNYAGANLTIDGGATLETTNNQQGSGILNNGGKVVLEGHIKHCVRDGIEHGDPDKTIESFTKAVERFANMQ